MLEDTITYLEMLERPAGRRVPAPLDKLALMRAEACTVSFYRYLYDTVGEPWLWFERRIIDDASVAAQIHRPAIEIFVLYVRGVPAGFFELDTAAPRETKLCYFGLIPDFIGRRLGRSTDFGCTPRRSIIQRRCASISGPGSWCMRAVRCCSRIRANAGYCRGPSATG